MTTTTALPTDITLSANKTELTVIFEDGCSATLKAELLRVESHQQKYRAMPPKKNRLCRERNMF